MTAPSTAPHAPEGTDRHALVRCTDVTRTFGDRAQPRTAVSAATCEIFAGEQVAVTGPSGSGKSTLLHLLAGLDTPTSGTIEWPAIGGRRDLRPGPVGVVFQAPSLMPPLDVFENVALVPVLMGDAPDAARAAARHALAQLDIADLASKLPDELSGGQAQRVAVARVLAGRPHLILADEPTGQLDHTTGAHVIDVLLAASRTSGAALVVTTHDPIIGRRLATQWAMSDGTLTTTEAL